MSGMLLSIYQRVILRNAFWVLAILLAIVGWLGSYIPTLQLDASADALVLEGDESLAYYRDISKRYGSEDFLLVTYQPQADLFAPEQLQTLGELRDRLAELPNVSNVTSILDVPLLESPRVSLSQVTAGEIPTLRTPGIDMDMVREELATSPIYKSLLTSTDGSTTAIQVNIQRDERYYELLNQRDALRVKAAAETISADEQATLDDLEKTFADYTAEAHERQAKLVALARDIVKDYRGDATVFLGGVPMIAVDMIAFVKSDLRVFGAGILLFIVVLLTVIFRRLRWVLIPLSTCVLNVVFMLGLLSFLDWRLTVISANFVALLLIITLSVTIHLVVRYREYSAAQPEADQFSLVSQTTAIMAMPCLYTTLTTLVAFASLVVSGIRPVIDFGWMMTIGVVSALVLTFIVMPCAMMLMKRHNEKGGSDDSAAFTRYFAVATERFGRTVVVVSTGLLLLSVWGITQLKVENRFIDYFHDTTEIYQGMETIDAELGGTIPLDIILDLPKEDPVAEKAVNSGSDDFDDFSNDFANDFADDFGDFGDAGAAQSEWFTVAGLQRIQSVHNYVDGLPETGKVLSLSTFYELMQIIMGNVDDLQLALAQRSLPESISSILIDPYMSTEVDQVRISVRVKETSRTLNRNQLLIDIEDHLVNELGFAPEQVHLTGMLVLYNNMLQSLFTSQIMTLSAVFVAILAMFMVLFRSLSLALIALAPNLLAAGAVLGGMGLAGIPLDMMTITIAAITVGIGVDNTIHYVHRFKQEFPTDRNYLATMYRCHASIGRAMYYTSSIIIFGFSILALSNFTPSIYFGLLTGLAMLAALLGAMLLLPKLLLVIKPLGPEIAIEKAADKNV
ncbi:RND family transporter [Zhongshania sp.]|uniref:efflux RND transporter permease subunit n=1 Tax=Zhongshania sp. TaxID=1971902 RepID=UPI003561C9DF